MLFEYDVKKSDTNKLKHGIDFEEAKLLWQDDEAIVIPARTIDEEPRFALIATLDEKCYSAIFTLRETTIRIISVRRCRKKEKRYYEENYQ